MKSKVIDVSESVCTFDESALDLMFSNNTATLLIRGENNHIKIILSKRMLDGLSHLLNVASMEYGDRNDKT